jgi:hypothetical protein
VQDAGGSLLAVPNELCLRLFAEPLLAGRRSASLCANGRAAPPTRRDVPSAADPIGPDLIDDAVQFPILR